MKCARKDQHTNAQAETSKPQQNGLHFHFLQAFQTQAISSFSENVTMTYFNAHMQQNSIQ
jgi:hypothetical protein